MHTIYATRQGFCFQDKYACLLFLQELRTGKLRELFTDFPTQNQQSLDILIKTGDAGTATEERVYEVKTGQKFKDDASTHKLTEVRDVIQNFIKYLEDSPNAKCFITFTTGTARPLRQYTGPADILFDSRRLDDPARRAADSLIALLGSSLIGSQRNAFNFFKRVKFDGLSYSNNQTWTRVDEDICSHITSIAQELSADTSVSELPNEYLLSKLYYTAQRHTGSGDNVAEHLIKEVVDFMMLRKILAEYTRPGTPPARLREQTLIQVRTDMVSKYKVEDLLPDLATDISASDTATGGVVIS
jgi:hypothetical protein